METKNYRRITYKERVVIETLYNKKMNVSQIAKELGKDRSTIYREIKRGISDAGWGYLAERAQFRSDLYLRTRRMECKLARDSLLRFYVLKRLLDEWTPETVSNMIKRDYPCDERMRISHESIYRYIYFECGGKMQKRLIRLLPQHKPKRSGRPKREIYMGSIIGRVSIDQRPASVETRLEEGHWEGDLIIGKGQKSAIGTLVERMTRLTIIVPLSSKKSKHVVDAFADRLNALPKNMRRTLTYDNGIEMAEHIYFTYRTGMPVYFAHPYSSWERPTNENTNGLIRRKFKKKTDFNRVEPWQLRAVEEMLNNRPRKVLGWMTPNEMLKKLAA